MKQDVKEIYLDNHIAIFNKPPGLLTQEGAADEISLQQIAKEHIKEKFQKPGNVFLEAVHRLDRSASGMVVFARTSKALSRLNLAIREKKFLKTYLACVEGEVLGQEAELRHYLTHEEHHAKVYTESGRGKFSHLKYKVLQANKEFSLLEISLFTGRYHQIRAQLSFIGHPIWGDRKYGAKTKQDKILLHHARLEIPHPTKAIMIQCEAPYFENWQIMRV